MAARPLYLGTDVLQRARDLEFRQRADRDIWKLGFDHQAESDITGLSKLIEPPPLELQAAPEQEPLPIVVSDRPDARALQRQAQARQAQQQSAPTENMTAPQAAAGQPAAMPTAQGAGEQAPATEVPMRPMSAPAPGGNHGEIDNSSREAFVRTAYPYMLEAAGGDQNLAELMLAKAISENGSIGSGRPFWANNFSGIKGEGDAGSVEADTWEDYGNGPVNIRDRFAAYSTPQAGMAAFMQFLRDNSRYHPALARYEQTKDASQLFRDILAAGYATDKAWADKVESIRANQVAPIVRGQSGQDMPRLSLNAAQPLAPGGSAAPPAPGGVSSAPPGAPPAPWEQAEAQGDLMLKENDGEDVGSFPTSARQIGNTGADSNLLPGDGGTPPTPEYDPRQYDEGPREYRPPAPVYADPTATDPAYTQNPNAAPMVDPLDPSTITPAALPPLSNGPRMMQPQPQYRDPREGQGIIARGIDAIGQYLPSAPIVDTKPGDAGAFMGAMPNTPGKLWEWRGRVAEGAADALSRGTGMDPDALVLNVEVGGIPIQMTVSELLENVTDPLLAAGWGVGDMVLDAAGRAVLRLVAPYAKGAARETIGRLLNSEPVQRGVEAVREGAEAVGREVAGGLMDLNPAMTPRIMDGGPGIGRAMAESAIPSQSARNADAVIPSGIADSGPNNAPVRAQSMREPWQMTPDEWQAEMARVSPDGSMPDPQVDNAAYRRWYELDGNKPVEMTPTLQTGPFETDARLRPAIESSYLNADDYRFVREIRVSPRSTLAEESRFRARSGLKTRGVPRAKFDRDGRVTFQEDILSDPGSGRTLTHEIGHSIENNLPESLLARWEREIHPATEDPFEYGRFLERGGEKPPTQYAAETPREDFAETFTEWRQAQAEGRAPNLGPLRQRFMQDVDAWLSGGRSLERGTMDGQRFDQLQLLSTPGVSPGRRGMDVWSRAATDAGNALAGSMVGAVAPADSNEERLRNMAVGAAGFPIAGRLMRRAGGALGTPGIGPNGRPAPSQRLAAATEQRVAAAEAESAALLALESAQTYGTPAEVGAARRAYTAARNAASAALDAENAAREAAQRFDSGLEAAGMGRRVGVGDTEDAVLASQREGTRPPGYRAGEIPTTRDDTPRTPSLNAAPSYAERGAGIGTRITADAGASLQGGVVGAAAGYGLPADSEEQRRRNALAFGTAGMVGMPVAGRVVGRGMRGAGRGTRLGIIPPHVADEMADTFPVRVPQDPAVIRAIESIGGTVDPERGVTINVTRAQGPQAAGMPATRGGVFYEAVPEGGRSNFVRGSDDPTGVGGSQVIPARPTTFRSPLIVSDAPGGTRGFDEAMQQLGARVKGDDPRIAHYQERLANATDDFGREFAQAQIDALTREKPITTVDVNNAIRQARAAGPEGSEARANALREVVRKYGGDEELIEPLLRVRGADASESEWAIRENILAAHARRNGYDGVVTVQQTMGATSDEIAAHPKVIAADQAYQDAVTAYEQAKAKHLGDLARRPDEPFDAYWDRVYSQPARVFDARNARANADPAVIAAESTMQKAEQAHRKAKQEAFDELSNRSRITELIDVREGANPTPGALDAATARTVQAWEDAKDRVGAAYEAIDDTADRYGWKSPEVEAAKAEYYRLVDEADSLHLAAEEALARAPRSDPGFSVRSDIPRPPGANWAALPFDPTSAAMGGAAGAMSEGEDGEQGDPLRTAAGVFIAGLGNSRYGRRFIANAARNAKPGPPPNLWEVMQGFRFSWGMLGNLAQTGLVNVAGGPVELAKGLPTEAIRMSLLRGRPIGTAHYAAEVASGLKDGARSLLATVLGEIPPSVRNAPDFRPPMSERLAGRMGQIGNVDTGAVVGEAIDLPGRLSSQAPDSLWRPLFLKAGAAKERNTIMAENGVSKLDPAAQWRELQRLTNNPTPAEAQRIAEASRKHADEMGLKGDAGFFERKLSDFMRGGKITTSADPLQAQVHEAAGSFIMPFLGAVYKLHKLAATGVPGVGFLANSKLPLDEKISRQVVGAATIYLLADYAAQGMITGPGPADPDEAAIVNKKMPPHSTYFPGVGWVPNDSLGSAGPYLNAIGGYYDARRYATEKDKTVAGKGDESTVKYVLRGFERFPVVQAAQSVIAMAESPIKGVSDFAANAASSFAPAPYRTYQASQDQYARSVDREAGMDGGIVPALAEQTRQKIVSRVGYAPGLGAREDLPPALDRFGRPIENERQGVSAFLPRVSNPKPDALTDIFTRAGIEPGMPPAEIDDIPLNTEQRREWLRVRGEWLASKQDILSRAADYPEARRKNVFADHMETAAIKGRTAVRRMFTPAQRAAALQKKKAS